MSVNEIAFGKRLRNELAERGFKFDRIESHATAPGIPDTAWVHHTGESGWLEIKETENQPTKIDYRPRQALWLDEHWKRGGNSATILHVKNGDHLFLIPGVHSIQAERNFTILLNLPDLPLYHLVLSKLDAWDTLARLIKLLRYADLPRR